MRFSFRKVAFLTTAWCLIAPVFGQETTGTIAGLVSDPAGGLIPGAEVTAVNTGTNATHRGTTNQLGSYSLRNIPVGNYTLRVEAPGFKRYEATNVVTQVNAVSRVDVNMSVGAVSESVEVSAEVVTVNTEDATLRTVVDERRVRDLPLNGRDPVQLMRLVAGVSLYRGSGLTSGTTYPGVVSVSVNGNRGNSTNYVLDGGQNNDHYSNAPNPMPNPDALQEFSVQTNNFSAEFGRNSGGIVNGITKSGTNDLHGAAFWYLRNNKLNAANFFAPPKPGNPGRKQDDGLRRNQFGFTAGGPVFIPKVYDGRNKSFFFFSAQGTRLRQRPTDANVNVLTPQEREGDFSGSAALRDPNSGGAPYPGNRIPGSQFFSASKIIIDNHIPVPTSGRVVTITNVANYDDNQYLAKGDQQVSSNLRLSGRAFWSRAHQPGNLNQRNYYEKTDIRDWRNSSYVGNAQWVISPSILNQTIIGYNKTDGPSSHIYPEKSWADLGVPITVDQFNQFFIRFQSISSINTGDTNNFIRDEAQFGNTTRWTRGRHNMSFGGEYHYARGDVVNNFRAQGRFMFNRAAGYTGSDTADFLIGRFSQFVQGVGEFKNTRFQFVNLFFSDSMKLTRRLTLDLGVRWEPYLPNTDTLGKLAIWAGGNAQSTRFTNAPPGILYARDPGIPEGGFKSTWNNFGPRIGLAYDLTGDGKTSLRAGFGIFYDRLNTLQTNSAATQAPFGTVVSFFGGARDHMSNPFANYPGGNPFKTIGYQAIGTDTLNPGRDVAFVLPMTAFLYAPDLRNPYVSSWNLTVERQVGMGWLARASYAGSKGTALASGRDINSAPPNAAAATSTTNQRRPLYPDYAGIALMEPSGNSIYNSLQLTAEKRFSQGFTVLANYTWAKTIDNNVGSANKANGSNVTNPLDQSFDRGPADYDLGHVFNFSGVWTLPVKPENRYANLLIGGWNMTSIVAWRSGFPFTVASGQDNARTGQGSQRADLTGQSPYLSNSGDHGAMVAQFLNRAAFRVNALGTYGVLGRNTYRGPGSFNTDFGLHKDFPMTERMKWQFRFEAFNLFNNVNFNNPTSTVTSGNFMRITSASDPRILQFALRFEY